MGPPASEIGAGRGRWSVRRDANSLARARGRAQVASRRAGPLCDRTDAAISPVTSSPPPGGHRPWSPRPLPGTWPIAAGAVSTVLVGRVGRVMTCRHMSRRRRSPPRPADRSRHVDRIRRGLDHGPTRDRRASSPGHARHVGGRPQVARARDVRHRRMRRHRHANRVRERRRQAARVRPEAVRRRVRELRDAWRGRSPGRMAANVASGTWRHRGAASVATEPEGGSLRHPGTVGHRRPADGRSAGPPASRSFRPRVRARA